jgi:hypothetical protein
MCPRRRNLHEQLRRLESSQGWLSLDYEEVSIARRTVTRLWRELGLRELSGEGRRYTLPTARGHCAPGGQVGPLRRTGLGPAVRRWRISEAHKESGLVTREHSVARRGRWLT